MASSQKKEAKDGVIRRFRDGRWDSIPRWQFHALTPFFTIYFAVRRFFEDRSQDVASRLAFTTALSLVPLLSVVASALAMFGTFDDTSPTLRSFLEQAFPASAAAAATYLNQFAQTSASSVGGISAAAFVIVSIFLFIEIERAFNRIWNAPGDRRWFAKMLTFYFIITVGPLLLTLSVGLSARAQLVLARLGIESSLSIVLSFLLTFTLFTLTHRLLPNAKVWWSAALVGGLFTTTVFELGKWGFNIYVNEVIFESYRTIYGALGLFPVFLLWVYVSWVIVLLGAELAYSVQHLRILVDVDAAGRRSPGKQKENIFNPLIGLEILAPVARGFKNGEGPTYETELVRQLGYTDRFIRGVIDELQVLGVVQKVEDVDGGDRRYIPAKQLDDIALFPIAEHFFEYGQANSHPMENLQRAYREATREILRGKTALALVAPNADLMRNISRFADKQAWAPTPKQDEDLFPGEIPETVESDAFARPVDEPEVEEVGREASVQIDDEALRAESESAVKASEARDYEDRVSPRFEEVSSADVFEPADSEDSEDGEELSELDRLLAEDESLLRPAEDSLLESPPVLPDDRPLSIPAAGRNEEITRPDFTMGEDSKEAIEVSDDFLVESSDVFDEDSEAAEDAIDMSIELDLGQDWQDFDVSEAYDDVLDDGQGPEIEVEPDARETAEMQLTQDEMDNLTEERRRKLGPPTTKDDL